MSESIGPISAMVELFGHRDLAVDDPRDFHRETQAFYENLVAAASDCGFPFKNCRVILDKCVIWHDSLEPVLILLQMLRMRLLQSGEEGRSSLLLRGLVLRRSVSVEMREARGAALRVAIPGLVLDSGAWELFGRVEAVKGIGIWVDEQLADEARDFVFQNFYVPDIREHSYRRFPDLKLSDKELHYQAAANIAGVLREAFHRSRKVARFYVPLFINWIHHMEVSEEPDDSSEDAVGIGLDSFFSADQLNVLKFVNGGELVFAKLLSRMYPADEALGVWNRSRWKKVDKYLMSKCRWLHTLLQKDDKGTRFPSEILSRSCRRAFAKAQAGFRKGEDEEEDKAEIE